MRQKKKQIDTSYLGPTAFDRSHDLIVSGIGHSVIRGLVTDRLMVTPRALESEQVDHKSANTE